MLEEERFRSNPVGLEYFIICGLGSLGQHCIVSLTEFGVKIVAIERQLPIAWEIESLKDLLDKLIIGDCRHNDILHRAQIQNCRAALIVTTDERVNVETAIAIRQLNPRTRLVVRSGKTNLNQLLARQLGNYVAFEPTELSTAAFTLAALGTEILGFFELEGQIWQVVRRQISIEDSWCERSIISLENNYRRILAHSDGDSSSKLKFAAWNAGNLVRAGDTIIYLKIANDFDRRFYPNSFEPTTTRTKNRLGQLTVWLNNISSFFTQLNFRQQIRRVALVNAIIIFILLIVGTVLFGWYDPEITTLSAFLATAVLLLGGYGDLFAELEDISSIPWWIRLFSLILTLVGTVFVGVIYALLIETFLSSRFEFTKHPPPLPERDGIAIVGMGQTGQKVRALLTKFQQQVVGITFEPSFYQQFADEMPLILGNLETALTTANLLKAKSLVIVTDDEILNLETALMARAIAPQLNLVLRTSGIRIARHLKNLLPNTQIVGVYEVAAAAFAGAAFGENILDLFRLGDSTILVTEYRIEAEDTLHGLLLADVAYGYGVVPIVYQQPNRASVLLPLDEPALKPGDRLIVLATIDGLRRIERGQLERQAKQWQIRIEKVLIGDAIFEGANAIARITGCSLALARATMNDLPQTLSVRLYQPQARRLVAVLKKALVVAHLLTQS